MAYTKPTVADFKAYFFRDFPYGVDKCTDVLDQDITKAQGEASFNVNEALFASQEEYSIGYNYLTAHYLVTDLRMAAQGIQGSYGWLEVGKSVGNVSQSFAIPEEIMQNPYYAMISKTNYGAKYLSLILPNITAQIFIAYGRTTP